MNDYREKMERIKALMHSKGFDTFNELADKMDMLPNTLTSSLRYMTKNDSYQTVFSDKLCSALDVEKNIFLKTITQELRTGADSSIALLEEKGRVFSKIANSYQKEISSLIAQLEKGDTYTLITTENPWEFKDIEIRDLILDRIKAGVKFRYVYPKPSEQIKIHFDKFENNIEWEALEFMHNKYTQKMQRIALDDNQFRGIDAFVAHPESYIKEHLDYRLVEDIVLTHPMFKFMLLKTQYYGEVKKFAFSEAIFAESYREMNNDSNSFWYPLPNNESLILFKSVESIFNN